MLIQGRFEFPITLSLFNVFELFDLILLTCELTVVHLIFLEMYKIFLPFFLHEDVKNITIYFIFSNIASVQSKLNLKMEKTFSVLSIERRLIT